MQACPSLKKKKKQFLAPFSEFPDVDSLQPADPKHSSGAGVDEGLNLLHCCNDGSPGFSSIEQDRIYSCAEDPES